MFELKPLNHEAIPSALEKANRYRLLNEPGAAESIYLDILAIDPDNQEALVNIVLAMSDRFSKDYGVGEGRIQDFLAKIISPNDLYTAEFLAGLEQAQNEVANKDLIEVTDFASFTK